MKCETLAIIVGAGFSIFAQWSVAATDTTAAPVLNRSQPTVSQVRQKIVKAHRTISVDKLSFRVAWHPSGRRFAVIDSDLNLVEFDTASGHKVRVLPTLVRGALQGGVGYSHDGKYLVGGNGVITVFDAATGQKVREILGPYERDVHGAQGFDTLVISPDSRVVAVRYSQYEKTRKKDISVFELDTGRLVFAISDATTRERGSTFSANLVYTPDSKLLLSSRYEFPTAPTQKLTGEVFRYSTYLDFLDTHTGEPIASIRQPHVQGITAQAVSADGKYIATGTSTLRKESTRNAKTGGWDYIDNQDPIRLWDAKSGQLTREMGPLRGAVRALSFSPDGSLLVSCQTDLTNKETLWLWDVATGQLIERVQTPNSANDFFDCAFSPDSSHIAFPASRQIHLLELAR